MSQHTMPGIPIDQVHLTPMTYRYRLLVQMSATPGLVAFLGLLDNIKKLSLTQDDGQITIMATAAQSGPYSDYIVWIQVLPMYFNQPWAKNFGYRILLALSTNFLGYGLAGLTRKFIVYESYCMWPEVSSQTLFSSSLS